MSLTPKAAVEIAELIRQSEALARGNASDRQQSSVLLARVKNIRMQECSSDELRAKYSYGILEQAQAALAVPKKITTSDPRYRVAFRNYMKTGRDIELRALESGQQTITWSQGSSGGYLVDQDFYDHVFAGLKQLSPFFDPSIVTLIQEPTFAMLPLRLSGWDLTSITSVPVGESVYNAPSATPSVSGATLSGYTHRISLAESDEGFQDISGSAAKITYAAAVAFQRGIGPYLTTGSGVSQPKGAYTAAPSSNVTLGTGNYNQTYGFPDQIEVQNVFFSVNRIHRASPKCCWVMTDQSWNAIRAGMYDTSRRPILDPETGQELLMGKRVLISPDLTSAGGSPVVQGEILFGNFEYFTVRLSAMSCQRSIETSTSQSDVTFGSSLWSFRLRCDSTIADFSNGRSAPIVSAAINYNSIFV
jgi:HK97 family phage major capsid protein